MNSKLLELNKLEFKKYNTLADILDFKDAELGLTFMTSIVLCSKGKTIAQIYGVENETEDKVKIVYPIGKSFILRYQDFEKIHSIKDFLEYATVDYSENDIGMNSNLFPLVCHICKGNEGVEFPPVLISATESLVENENEDYSYRCKKCKAYLFHARKSGKILYNAFGEVIKRIEENSKQQIKRVN
ncbi:MAG: hypothetical protein QXL94_01650 [Candidatus Parvarchaeum sp.]